MKKQRITEIQVGLFVSAGVILSMLAILLLSDGQSFFSSKLKYHAHFGRVDGLITGAKVILGGVPIGTVETIHFDPSQRNIKVEFSVDRASLDWIRKDSVVEIATQGVLGDKYLSVETGSTDQPPIPPNSEIPNRPAKDLSQFLNKGDQLMLSLNSIAITLDRILKNFDGEQRSENFFKNMTATSKNLAQLSEKVNRELDQIPLKKAAANLNQIFQKINEGTGTVGALINDPSLYDDLKSLLGGANRNRIIRNLVRQSMKDSLKKNAADSEQPPQP